MANQKNPKHYCNNKDLYQEMKAFKELSKTCEKGQRPQISEYIGKCISLIANRLATKPNFAGYTFRDEMISDGIENCILYIHNFNPEKYDNPFAYFTQIIKFSFIRRIDKEAKQRYAKIKNTQNYFTMHELVSEMNDRFDRELYENNQKFVEDFEKKLSDKKKKVVEKETKP